MYHEWDQIIGPSLVDLYSSPTEYPIKLTWAQRIFRLRRNEIRYHPIISNQRSGEDSGFSSDEDEFESGWTHDMTDQQEKEYKFQIKYFNLRGKHIIVDENQRIHGIQTNYSLFPRMRRQVVPDALGTVNLDLRLLTAYPVAYQVVRPDIFWLTQSRNYDTWMVFTYDNFKEKLVKHVYWSLEHAIKERGENIIILGACYGHLRVILRDLKGNVRDILTSITDRIASDGHRHILI